MDTKTEPLLSDRSIKGIIDDVFGTGIEDFQQVACEVRRRYEADRQKTRAVVQSLVDALHSEYTDHDTPQELIDGSYALSLARSELNITPKP